MARPPKFDYDSDAFYEEVLTLAIQGLTDKEIATALQERFDVSLSPEVFSCMKNGSYKGWSKAQNKERSERLSKVLARGRVKIVGILRNAYLKSALGGKMLKSKSVVTRRLKLPDGTMTDIEDVQTTESENEQPANVQAISTLLFHYDPDWRKAERGEDEEIESGAGVSIDKWIKDNGDD
ncbi:MAG: hypothetical protein R3Y50_05970 [Rikenellaceae bacterium]